MQYTLDGLCDYLETQGRTVKLTDEAWTLAGTYPVIVERGGVVKGLGLRGLWLVGQVVEV